MTRIFIERVAVPEDLTASVGRALEWIGAAGLIGPSTRVFVKPNLTWRKPTPGVTVTPPFLRALVHHLVQYTPHVTLGESEGGQASFKAEDAFENHGLYALRDDYGVRVVNLSQQPHETATTRVAGRDVSVYLPSMLLHDVDVFITVPVPKMHALTGVSLGFKNQWGCLGDEMRVTLHPYFDRTVLAINKLVKTRLCIFDGTYFLDHTGPMTGEAVPMNLIIAGDDVGAATLACCQVMQINPDAFSHLRLARLAGLMPANLDAAECSQPPSAFASHQFSLRRALINYIHVAAFRVPVLNRLFYASVFADALHEALWFIRRQPLVRRLLYGKYGTGEANRGGRVA